MSANGFPLFWRTEARSCVSSQEDDRVTRRSIPLKLPTENSEGTLGPLRRGQAEVFPFYGAWRHEAETQAPKSRIPTGSFLDFSHENFHKNR